MKVIDSGMPEEVYWNGLFDIPRIIKWLDIKNIVDPIAEIGCGYGTFTVPLAKKTNNQVLAFDIDPSMIEITRNNVQQSGLSNVQFFLRDILETGTGLESHSIGMILLFNILHFDERRAMLEENFIEGYTVIPKFGQIGFEIAAMTFLKSKLKSKTGEEKNV